MAKNFVKPPCELLGEDGNVFVLAGKVGKVLKRAGYPEKADEFYNKLKSCEDYDAALRLMTEYVKVS